MLSRISTVIFTALFGLVFIGLTTAGKSKKDDGMTLIKEALKKYQKSEAVKVNIDKTVRLALLDEKKNSEGTLWLSKGQLRLDITKPEASTVIVTKKIIWVITPAGKELGGKTQVMKISSSSFKKQAKAPLALLLGRPSAWDQFEIKKRSDSAENVKFDLAPKTKDAVGEIVAMKVELDKNKSEIKSISFSDDIENETQFNFKSVEFGAKIKSDSFDYVPPADADVTEYK